jgi:hypothetical protein
MQNNVERITNDKVRNSNILMANGWCALHPRSSILGTRTSYRCSKYNIRTTYRNNEIFKNTIKCVGNTRDSRVYNEEPQQKVHTLDPQKTPNGHFQKFKTLRESGKKRINITVMIKPLYSSTIKTRTPSRLLIEFTKVKEVKDTSSKPKQVHNNHLYTKITEENASVR